MVMLRDVIIWTKERGRWVVPAALILVNVVLLSLLFVRQASYSAVPAAGLPHLVTGTVFTSPADSGTSAVCDCFRHSRP